jgi:hypothetical protein
MKLPRHLEKRYIEFVAVLIPLVLAFYINNYPHENYPYLLHADEWQHAAQVMGVLQIGGILHNNPYFAADAPISEPEFGYHFFVAFLSFITRVEPIWVMRLMPFLTSAIMIIGAYALAKRMTGAIEAGFFAALFASLIKSNITLLGPIFAVPLSLSMALLPWAILLAYIYIEEDKKWAGIAFVPFSIFIVTVHLIFGVALVMCLALYAVFLYASDQKKSTKAKIPHILLFIALVAAVGLLIMAPYYWRGFSQETLDTLGKLLTFEGTAEDFSQMVIQFKLRDFLGWLFIISLVAGAVAQFMSRKFLLLCWIAPLLLLIIGFNEVQVTYFIPYRRLLMYFVVPAAIIAGIGLNSMKEIAVSKIKKLKDFYNLVICSILGLFIIMAYVQPVLEGTQKLYHYIDPLDYSAMKWIKANTSAKIVLAVPRTAIAITPITGLKTCAIIFAQLGNYDKTLYEQSWKIEDGCTELMSAMDRCGADAALLHKQMCCKGLKLVNSPDGKDCDSSLQGYPVYMRG